MELVTFIALSSLIFTGTIVILVMLLGLAKNKLVASGPVRILINGDEEKSPTVRAGGTLLSVLADQKVFLPSACGGGGTCALCKCQILEGGGDILPTEVGHLTRAEQKDHWRLACQVKVKSDMKIHVPEEIFSIKKFNCTVKSNGNVATFIKELDLSIDDGQNRDFEAGGYVQIDIPPYEVSTRYCAGPIYCSRASRSKARSSSCASRSSRSSASRSTVSCSAASRAATSGGRHPARS
jgi:Na+-transporting NADH:ubiquinone oxidoreductase subunit F